MATIKTTPIIAASTAPALEVTTVTEVITRLAAWLRRLPPPQERIGRLLADHQPLVTAPNGGSASVLLGLPCRQSAQTVMVLLSLHGLLP